MSSTTDSLVKIMHEAAIEPADELRLVDVATVRFQDDD